MYGTHESMFETPYCVLKHQKTIKFTFGTNGNINTINFPWGTNGKLTSEFQFETNGKLKTINFPFRVNGKLMFFRYPNSYKAHYSYQLIMHHTLLTV